MCADTRSGETASEMSGLSRYEYVEGRSPTSRLHLALTDPGWFAAIGPLCTAFTEVLAASAIADGEAP